MQSWQWGQVKSHFGWQPLPFVWHDDAGKLAAASLILQRTVNIGGFTPRLRVLYAPKGPLLNWSDIALVRRVLDDLQNFAKQKSAIFIKIDPDLCLGWGVPGEAGAQQDQSGQSISQNLLERGWIFSDEQVQFRNTVLIDLTPDEDQILAGMKQKTRYNIRLSARSGVSVRSGGLSDLDMLYEMYAKTAVRDGFAIRSPEYYHLVWETFMIDGFAEPLIAESEGKPIAGIFIFRFAGTAHYLYGMSLEEQRDKMPNYLLQWEAIRQSKAAGCTIYDMWGAPDE
ncbi:MAG: peptidoglycan bridge formation glycyltransferase FemA/FemB family protein, partial [Chloroflexota bacterium]